MKRRKIKTVPLLIASAATLSIVAISGVMIYKLFLDSKREFKKYNEDTKEYGTVQHIKEKEKNKYISVFYPETDNNKLNELIKTTYTDYINQKVNEDDDNILYMDYDAKCIYKQYAVIKYHFKTVVNDEETDSTKLMTYDLKQNKQLTLKDCLRGKYVPLLQQLGAQEINKDSTNIEVQKKQFIYYTDDTLQNGINVEYEKNKSYIKLANKNIPSDTPLDVKQPNTMKIDPNKKMVAITLDDGPHKTRTQQAMDVFEKYGGRGTFFQLGRNMNYYPDIVKEVYERGHEIASHTYAHKNLAKSDTATIEQEISLTQDVCFKITGYEPVTVRPPYGSKNDMVKNIFSDYNLRMVLWDGDTLDWKYSKTPNGAQIICDNIIRDAKENTGDGNIVLIHDIHQNSIDGLNLALEQLSKEGYQFVTVSDLYRIKGHREYR